MAQRDTSKPIPIPPKGLLFSEHCQTFATIKDYPTRGLVFLPQPITRNRFAPNIFGKKPFLAMISPTTFIIYLRRDAIIQHDLNTAHFALRPSNHFHPFAGYFYNATGLLRWGSHLK